jgi:protein-disulfide isomerase
VNKRYIIGAVVAAVALVAVLVGIQAFGGDDDGGPSSIEGTAAVQQEFAEIPASGSTIGEADAPVTIVEYGDLSCPACKQASDSTVPEVVTKYVRTGKAKMEFRPIAFINESSERGALGAEAAAMQDAIWPFVTLLYENQAPESQPQWLTDDLMADAVGKLGLDVDKWKSDYMSNDVNSAYFERADQAKADEVDQTPTFVITGPNGTKKLIGAVNVAEFDDAIAEVG